MTQTSLRENLSKIGEPNADKRWIHIASDFHSRPKSLKAMIYSMNSPKMESWAVKCEDHQAVAWWTFDCQGITTDGRYLYAVNNNEHESGAKGIFKFNFGYGNAVKYRRWPFYRKNHIGPPSYFEGKIYVPVETDDAPRVWILDTELNTLALAALRGTEISKQGSKMPWCAINPWNRFLYSSRFGDGGGDRVIEVHCYDPAKFFDYKKSLRLQGHPLYKVQGGCFSANGHLYLTSHRTKHIHGYNALNGSNLGSFRVPSDWSGAEEMEGIAIGNMKCKATGDLVPVHVLVLDNDRPNVDSDIWLKHIAVPTPEFL